MEQPTREGLVRGIHRWDLVAVVINGVIGAPCTNKVIK